MSQPRFVKLTHPSLQRYIWVNPAHVAKFEATALSGSDIWMSYGDVVRVAHNPSELAQLLEWQ